MSLNSVNGKITISRDVIFHEDDFSTARNVEGTKGKVVSEYNNDNNLGIVRIANRDLEIPKNIQHDTSIHSEDSGVGLFYNLVTLMCKMIYLNFQIL